MCYIIIYLFINQYKIITYTSFNPKSILTLPILLLLNYIEIMTSPTKRVDLEKDSTMFGQLSGIEVSIIY